MSTPHDRLIDCLLANLHLETSIFHMGQYCGEWQASTSGLARAGFHWLLHGSCYLHRPDLGQSFRLDSGDIVLFLRDVPHFLGPQAALADAACAPRQTMQALARSQPGSVGLACGFFDFRPDLGAALLGAFPEQIILRHADPALVALRPLFTLVRQEAEREGEASLPLLQRLLDLIFFYAIRHWAQAGEVEASLWALLAAPEFSSLLAALLAEPGQAWNIETMAELSRMSRARFHKRFAEVSGTSPSHFLLQVRMQAACRLLDAGNSLARVAEQVGYQSEAAFSRAFKKATGRLPGAYRRQRRQAA